MKLAKRFCALAAATMLLSACSDTIWNNPHASADSEAMVLYSNFAQRPKHLDPARSYSSDESNFIDQIYEPPLQYHYLKRPYELEPMTLTEMPRLTYHDSDGNELPADTDTPAFSTYHLNIKSGIYYQPHAAFARNEDGSFYYDFATETEGEVFRTLKDFTVHGTQELKSDDYIYQIKRLADPKRLAPLRGLLSQYIVGMSEFSEQVTAARKELDSNDWLDLRPLEMAGVKKIDDYNFSITLKGKYPQFKYWLAFHFFAPVAWEIDRFYHLPGLPERNITLDWHPVGTGAYMMTENNPNSEIILERNPNYRDDFYPSEGTEDDKTNGLLADAGKKLPFIDKAVFRLEKEAIPIWTKFLQGYYDRAGISSDSFDQAISMGSEGIALSDEMSEKGIRLYKAVQPATYYMGFNMLDSVVGGDSERARKLRQAIAIAYNEEEYITIFQNGRGETAMSPVPPGIFGYQTGEQGINDRVFNWFENNAEGQQLQRKPIEAARQLLAEAGYPNGRDAETGKPLVLNLDITSSSSSKARLAWIQKQFEKLDLQLNIRGTDYNRFKEKMKTGNAQIYFWGWLADYPDPENFLFLLYGPNGQVSSGGSGVNSANYNNPEYNRLFEHMQVMNDTPERMAVIKQMLDILHHDTPWASSFHPHSYTLSNSWVLNYKPHGITKTTLKFHKLDIEQRQQKQQDWNKPVLLPLILVGVVFLMLTIPGYLAFKRRQTRTIGE